jgi:hypothetical protein
MIRLGEPDGQLAFASFDDSTPAAANPAGCNPADDGKPSRATGWRESESQSRCIRRFNNQDQRGR